MEDSDYLILRSDKASVRELALFYATGRNAGKVLEAGPEPLSGAQFDRDYRLIIVISIILCRIVAFFRKPLEIFGLLLEFFLNFWSLNGGGLFEIITNVLTGKIVVPQRGSATYFSISGHIDTRLDLHKFHNESTKEEIQEMMQNPSKMEGRALMDLCAMASKLAYENANVVNNVVTNQWKMHFVEFFNCWNEYQKQRSTQVFILCDKPFDANLILITFRGTEPFDSDDWITDLDYSWFQIPQLGKIHMGFLEALGLGSRSQIPALESHLQNPALSSVDNLIAYYAVRNKLKTLLKNNKNAKFIITGHSLGGALAILFPAILLYHEEMEIMERMECVYTFGQPRVGNEELERFMREKLSSPVEKYFRVVYCNDVVPRLPFDDRVFLFKHFGTCLYYDSLYVEKKMREEPNSNYFGMRYILPIYFNAGWELMRGFIMKYVYGDEYKETWVSILFRVFGLIMPGISEHLPINYVNCARLGRFDDNKEFSNLEE
ncbi:hypothetical protein LUZ60_001588 [Juncus effusus]|nr:hypothetical protein LUZ60_001588 [Juncus effusus]